MDKNYNVDDILSEIKQRKSRQRAENAPVSRAESQRDVDLGQVLEELGSGRPMPPKAPPVRGASPQSVPSPVEKAEPEPQPVSSALDEDGFRFQFPAPAPPSPPAAPPEPERPRPAPSRRPAQRERNPLDFTGHVRPLTDRAKMRPSKLSQPRLPDPEPEPEGFRFDESQVDRERPREVAPVIDFTAFRAPDLESGESGEDLPHEQTRVLPQFSTGQELLPEDIQSIDFSRLDNGDAFYDYEEDEPVDDGPGSSSFDFSEYNSKKDRRDVALDIARVKLWLFIRTGVTALLTLVLFWLAFSGKYYLAVPLPSAIAPETDVRMYMLACTICTGLIALVGSSTMGGGILSLVKMRANSDSLAALALLASVSQCVIGVVKPELARPEELNFYFAVAGLAMLFNAMGKMAMINRIQANFRIIASERPKKALLAVESEAFCHEFVPDSTRRKPTIAYSASADFFTDFLGLSYSDKYDVGINRAVAPVCLGGAVIVGVSTFFLTDSIFSAVSAFTAILCVCASLSATFIENIPLGKLTRKLSPQGGMVSGNKAVEDFCDTRGLVLTETDLFPEGSVTLHGIKAFSKGRIDEAILDAASVICDMEGALSSIFLEMIGGDKKLLRKVDNVVYEQGMGVSAWVNSHRVLIGNRQLMLNHGINLPPDSLEGQPEGEVLYLSSSGEASARFLVSYHIDEELAQQLDILGARGTKLIVYTSDANITTHKLWELYGYPEELIHIMPTRQQYEYRKMAAPRENAMAEIVYYAGRASTMVKAVVACINARSSILTATVIQLLQIMLGYGLVAFRAFMGSISTLGIVELLIYQMFWFVSILIIQKVRQS